MPAAKSLMRTARAAALAALCVCACTAVARAGDDDPNATQSSGGSIYDKMLDVVGLGGQGTIQYSERSPLVVPPTRDLPPPGANAPPAVPNWPKDPDIARSQASQGQGKARTASRLGDRKFSRAASRRTQRSPAGRSRRDSDDPGPCAVGPAGLSRPDRDAARRASSASIGSRRSSTRRLPANRRGPV